MTTSLDTLETRLHQDIGDYIEVDTTTNITTNTLIISTTLNQYDRGNDDAFNEWYVYITEGNNSGVERLIKDYATASGQITVYGANLLAETGAVTIRVYRYSRTETIRAINNALREVYPSLFNDIDDMTLIAGNWLPNSHFEKWTASTEPDFYARTDVTSAKTTTAGLYRGGTASAKVTASAANGYLGISSNSFPRLLDLMGKTVDFKAWAYPEVADNATLVIYTLQADGTAQTLTSTTSCPASKWTLLSLIGQALNDNLVQLDFRFKVTTNTQYAYFDNARVRGEVVNEYVLPQQFHNGHVSMVWRQVRSFADDPCDDLHPTEWARLDGSRVISDGTYEYLQIPSYPDKYLLRLKGYAPFTDLSAATDTINLDGQRINSLLALAKYELYKTMKQPVSSGDTSRYEIMAQDAYEEYQRLLPKQRMSKPADALRIRVY